MESSYEVMPACDFLLIVSLYNNVQISIGLGIFLQGHLGKVYAAIAHLLQSFHSLPF